MPIYRLYEVDGAGNFMAVVHLEAAADAECLANARRLQLTARCELWECARIVAVLDPPLAEPTDNEVGVCPNIKHKLIE